MKKGWIIFLFIAAAFVAFVFGIFLTLLAVSLTQPSAIRPWARQIVVIRIDGVISASGAGDSLFSSGTSPEDVIEPLRRADQDEKVKAILLRINSPGGTPAASEEMFKEIRRTKKPVVASVGDIAASAAYLLASGTDKIVSSASSEVGSIGVIQVIPNLEELYRKLGVDYQVISQGKFKDMFSGSRALTEEERTILAQDAKIIYDQFIEAVAQGRRISEQKVNKLATGQTFPGSVALKLRLVDELGNYQDAIDLAAKLGKIEGEPELIEYGAPTFFGLLRKSFQRKTIDIRDILLPEDLSRLPNLLAKPKLFIFS